MPFLNRISTNSKDVVSSTPPVPPTFSANFLAGSYMISQASSALVFSSLSQLTIEFYFRRENNFSSQVYAMILTFANASSTANNGLFFSIVDDGRLLLNLPNRFVQETTVNTILLNTWYHVCVQCNSAGQLTIFIDGVNRSQRTHSNLFSNFTNNRCGLNTAYTSVFSESFFIGQVGDVRVSNTWRYSNSGFTRPAAALQNDSNTIMLLTTTSSNDVITDKSGNNLSFTSVGTNITFSSLTPYT